MTFADNTNQRIPFPSLHRATKEQAAPKRMDPLECFAVIVSQVENLANASQARAETPFSIAATEASLWQSHKTVDPTTWSTRRKWIYTILAALTMFNASFASTAPNGSGPRLVQQFALSNEEMVFIATSFVGGCVAGPILWAPLSEVYGRRIVLLISMLCYALTNIGCALAPFKAVLFGSRFLAGVFASSAFSNTAALVTDLFAPPDRAKPMVVVSLAPLLGPCFGPLFGAGVSKNLGWRYVFWLLGLIGLVLELVLLLVPETYAPVLAKKGKPKENIDPKVPWSRKARSLLVLNLGRPVSLAQRPSSLSKVSRQPADLDHHSFPPSKQLNMMLREPIVMCANFYLSFFFALM